MACTFDNQANDAKSCAICGTSRQVNDAKKPANVKSQQPLQQRTLFGGVVVANNNHEDRPSSKMQIPKKKKPRLEEKKASPVMEGDRASMGRKVSTAPYPVLRAQAIGIMKTTFGIDKLRNLQPIAVQMALQKKSQIIVMATGGGKSLCYQLPASVLGGVTLVISPLIALMVDQVQALNAKGIEAALMSSASGERNNKHVVERLLGRSLSVKKKNAKTDAEPPLKPLRLLYCTPELLQTERFQGVVTELHNKQSLALVAIDEAHCLSMWGHDFRPAYRKLSWLSSFSVPVPIMACTATATPKVIQDIRETLGFPEGEVPCHIGSFNRPNISYEVRYKDSLDAMRHGGAIDDLLALIKEKHSKSAEACSGIVYVHKRDDTTFIAKQITSTTGVPAAAYHAGLKDAERSSVQQDWTSGKIKVAVATVAFGMGIDLAHVRYVLHWTLAKTVEGFYQESGRAGRDGLPAQSVLYYSKEDASRFAFIIRQSASSKAAASRQQQDDNSKAGERTLAALEKMMNYCMLPGCRRQFLLAHFGEDVHPQEVCCKTCDYCENPIKVQKAIQASDVVKDVLKSAAKYTSKVKNMKEWDGQWQGPHGDDIDHDDDGFDERWEGDLRITNGGHETNSEFKRKSSFPTKKGGFKKASSVLAKYEMMEFKQAAEGGFVTFKAKDDPGIQHRPVEIPLHLRGGLPDPLAHLAKKKPENTEKSSADLASQAQSMRENLERLKQERVARLAALHATSKAASSRPPPPPPPPSLTFQHNRR